MHNTAEHWNFMLDPGLYVVATPIGNLEDISFRAVRVLKEANCIAAEDTRHSRILLNHYGIDTNLVSLHEHNEENQIPRLLARIVKGEAIALISDAGTPLISDPGFQLVRALAAENLPVFSVPGPSAVTAALSIAGIASDRFRFEGFLPAKSSSRIKRLTSLERDTETLIFFESSHRIEASIADMLQVFGPTREAALCRELTKRFETVIRGSLEEIQIRIGADGDQRRGEFVVLVSGSQDHAPGVDGLELACALREHLPASQAAKVAAKISGTPRKDIYESLKES
ncbi:MAG: 16S rRNA (cytidine1402-2'-O)-methyltransferase [Rhodothermales bacterium]|jgi:16S rRNA (cytidine1402-2'-O)-methyltransferase